MSLIERLKFYLLADDPIKVEKKPARNRCRIRITGLFLDDIEYPANDRFQNGMHFKIRVRNKPLDA